MTRFSKILALCTFYALALPVLAFAEPATPNPPATHNPPATPNPWSVDDANDPAPQQQPPSDRKDWTADDLAQNPPLHNDAPPAKSKLAKNPWRIDTAIRNSNDAKPSPNPSDSSKSSHSNAPSNSDNLQNSGNLQNSENIQNSGNLQNSDNPSNSGNLQNSGNLYHSGFSNNSAVDADKLPSFEKSEKADKTDCDETFTYANALMRAENAYVRRRYTTVLEILKPIYENIQCIDDSVTVLEIDLLMGVANNELGRQARADSFFLNVLRTDPDHVVGSIITIPESSAKRIEQLRADNAEELNALRAQSSPNTIIESLYILVEKEHHPYWINFLPFGAGQFQMHQTAWGAVYASTQIAGIALSILGGSMVEYYRGDAFTYTPQDRARAKNWQNAQIVGIALLGASYIAGVIHALFIHEDSTLIIHSPSQTRPDIAHRAAPFILPDGGGLTYGAIF